MTTQPDPSVWPPPPTSAPPLSAVTDEAILDFPRQSVPLLLLLVVVTLGVYANVWLLRQARLLNARLLPSQAAPLPFVIGTLVLCVVSAVLDVPCFFTDNAALNEVSNVFDRVSAVADLVVVFQVRNRLNVLLDAASGSPHWFSGVWTFLFGPLYVQHKINTLRRRAGA